MRLNSIFIMIIVGMGCTIGFMGFAIDLTNQYDIEGLPENLKTSAEDTIDNMNQTTNTILEIFSGKDNSWIQTSFNIFFALPVELLNNFADVATFGAVFTGTAAESISEAGGVPIPGWITTTIILSFIVAVVFGLWSTIKM